MSINNPVSNSFLPVGKPLSWLTLVILVAILLRLPGIDAVLAGDELAMISLWGQMPYEKIFQNYQYPNNHIFLAFILSFVLKSFGLHEWLLRLPILVCGILSIYLGYRAGKDVGKSSLSGLIVALLLALSGYHIIYSTHARGYLLIMVLAQICFAGLSGRMIVDQGKVTRSYQPQSGFYNSLGWVLIWVVGSWTLPTFMFFESSVAVFLFGIILFRYFISKESSKIFIVPVLTLMVGFIAFYWQYYVLISPEMLVSATSNAAQISLNSLFREVMEQWLTPFGSLDFIFLFLALAGGLGLWKQHPYKLLLLGCVLLGPIFIGISGFQLGLLPGIPPARTYLFLQPFFFILVALGILMMGGALRKAVEKNYGGEKFSTRVMSGAILVVATGLILTALLNGYKEIYPKRAENDPLRNILEFVRTLNKNDLLLVPTELHVGFYLYGASEMRQRVENILREGRIDAVYFLEYRKNGKSSFIKEKGSVYITGYPSLNSSAKGESPALPQQALEEVDRYGPFVFHKLKAGWLNKRKIWDTGDRLEIVGILGAENFKWEKAETAKGINYGIRFVDSFIIAMKIKQPKVQSGLSLNLMDVSGSDRGFSAAYLEGKIVEKQIKYNPAWRLNNWTLDHPYGSNIFDRAWNPAISISAGESTVAVLDVQYFHKGEKGAMKDFLSYEISRPDVSENTGVNRP